MLCRGLKNSKTNKLNKIEKPIQLILVYSNTFTSSHSYFRISICCFHALSFIFQISHFFFLFFRYLSKSHFFSSSSWPICFSFIYLLLNWILIHFFLYGQTTWHFFCICYSLFYSDHLYSELRCCWPYISFYHVPPHCFPLTLMFQVISETTFPKRICSPKMCQWVVPSLCEVWQEGIWRQTYSVELPSHELSSDQIKELHPHP